MTILGQQNKEVEVAVLGSLNIDYFFYVKKLPKGGETVSAVDSLQGYGGKGANQAVAGARVGASVSMIGQVADDVNGKVYVEHLKNNEGVLVDQINILDSKLTKLGTGMASISVDENGENNIIVYGGANMKWEEDVIQLASANSSKAKVLAAQLEVPLPVVHTALKSASESKTVTVFNPSPSTSSTQCDNLWKYVDVLVVNEHEACDFSGLQSLKTDQDKEQVCQFFKSKGCKHIIITLGGDGVYTYDCETSQAVQISPVKVSQVVDTTGAGDCFLGSLAALLSKGETILESARKANLIASISVQSKGCQSSYPTMDQVKAAYPDF